MRVKSIYHTKSGSLRAKVVIEGRTYVVKITKVSQSLISCSSGAYLIRGIDIEKGCVEYQFLYEYSTQSLKETPIATVYLNKEELAIA